MILKIMPRHKKAHANWTALNKFLLTAGIDDCNVLLQMEASRGFEARPTFVKRINGRYLKAVKIAESRVRR